MKYKVGDVLKQRFYRTGNKYFVQIIGIRMNSYLFQDWYTKTQESEWIKTIDNNSSHLYEIKPITDEEKLELL